MNDCPECGRTDGNHWLSCSKSIRDEPVSPIDYRPPYFNENGFLQLDLRPANLTRTIADFKALMATDQKGKSNAA